MILQYKETKKENEELYEMVDAKEAEIKQLKLELEQAQNNYKSLKTARMLEVADGDIEESKKKMSEAMTGEKHPFYGKHHSGDTKNQRKR